MSRAETGQLPWLRLGLGALLVTLVMTPGHLATPDAHLRLAQARNLVTQGSLAVPEGVGELSHGNLAPGKGGRTHSVYNPGHALILAPVYVIASRLPIPTALHPHYVAAFGASFLGILTHLATGLLLLALLLRLGAEARISLVITGLFAFGTVSLPLSADGYDHVFEGFAIVLSLFLLVQPKAVKEASRPALAGLALGGGILFRSTVLLALPGMLWIAPDRGCRVRLVLGIVPAALFALFYNLYRFDSLLATGYPAAWQLAHGNEIGQAGFRLTAIPHQLLGLLVSPGKGIFWFSPVIALAIPAWSHFRRARWRIADGVALITAVYLLFYAANFAWHGSVWSWGPRYIVPILAPVMISIAFLPKEKPWRFLLLVLGIISVVIQGTAMIADHRRHLLKEYTQEVAGFEQRLLYDSRSSPVTGQFRSAVQVLRSTVERGDYRLFIAPGPWRSTARPASNRMMLERSIDLNVVDLWWVRLTFMTSGGWGVTLALLVGGLTLPITIWLALSIWRTAPEA